MSVEEYVTQTAIFIGCYIVSVWYYVFYFLNSWEKEQMPFLQLWNKGGTSSSVIKPGYFPLASECSVWHSWTWYLYPELSSSIMPLHQGLLNKALKRTSRPITRHTSAHTDPAKCLIGSWSLKRIKVTKKIKGLISYYGEVNMNIRRHYVFGRLFCAALWG